MELINTRTFLTDTAKLAHAKQPRA